MESPHVNADGVDVVPVVAQNIAIPTAASRRVVEQQDVERIARATLKELGVFGAELTVAAVSGQPGRWRIDIRGTNGPLNITCGQGSSPQWVRDQIFEKYLAQN
jgi:outer membrane receptor protein involved in Fe transport